MWYKGDYYYSLRYHMCNNLSDTNEINYNLKYHMCNKLYDTNEIKCNM